MHHFTSIRLASLALAALLLPLALAAQLSEPLPPKSLALALPSVKAVDMPAIDRRAIDAEDRANNDDGQPLRVAYPFATQLDMKAGRWDDLPGGEGRIWRLRVRAAGAQAISLLYDRFYLPPGATMHVYNPANGETIGAFTSRNNKASGKFATALTYGDVAVVEYFEPADQRGRGEISVEQVGHAYRIVEVLAEAERAAAMNSGACQVNVNCSPEGDAWQDHKRSVARLLINGSAFCTGSLITNTSQDGRPYFLTADHCIGTLDAVSNPDASQWVFNWNYERTACANSSGTSPYETTSGATLLANDAPGDFALFELTEDPNAVYGVYFAGFSAEAASTNGGVGIHHPAGDYKKIATHSQTPTSYSWFGSIPGTHWQLYWDATANGHSVTEGGSSGSPLFNAAGQIIGQLHGGSSINCSNPAADVGQYGKIAFNWDNDGATSPQRRLRDWLDPAGGGTTLTAPGGYLSPPPPTVAFGVADLTVSEASASQQQGCRGYFDVDVPVAVYGVATAPVTVSASAFGSAGAYDAQLIAGSLQLGGPSGASTGALTLRIWDDAAVEATETLTLSLQANGGGATLGAQSILDVTIEDDDLAPGTTGLQTLSTEDFAGGLPGTWSVTNAGAAAGAWQVTAARSANSLNGSNFLLADSDAPGSGTTTNTSITTAPLDVSAASTLSLEFDEYFRVYTSGGTETGTVEVLANGAWTQVLQHTEAGGSVGSWTSPNAQVIDLTPYISSALQLRFTYQGAYDWYWAIDNVALRGELSSDVATTVVAPFQRYLAPNAEVVLRDPATGSVIASVTNLTATDHGCVTVELERDAAAQATYPFHSVDPAEAAYAKTLQLSPALAPGNASYELRWYFTPAEVVAWETATGKSLGSDGGIAKVAGATPFSAVTPATYPSYTVDWQPATLGFDGALQYLEATFATGFSGFGLVSDPAAAALPVDLIAFTGEHLPGRGNVLTWTTATEANNAHFVVEASHDGAPFRAIGVEPAGDAPDRLQHYSLLDAAPAAPTMYYRLRQVDDDGSATLSDVIAVEAPVTSDAPMLTARFDDGQVRVHVPHDLSELSLSDAAGRTLNTWAALQAGYHQLAVMAQLPRGVYALRALRATGETETVQLVR